MNKLNRHFTIFDLANNVVVVQVMFNVLTSSNVGHNSGNITEQQTVAEGSKPNVEPIQETFIHSHHVIVANSYVT